MTDFLECSDDFLISDMLDSGILDKKFRFKQIIHNIYKNCVVDFDKMSDLSKDLRSKLAQRYSIIVVNELERFVSQDGTIKFLFGLSDENAVEAVYLKDKNNRVTFCVSSQVGCRMGCTFCKTSRMGLLRNLTAAEILSEIFYLWSVMRADETVTDTMFNIVFMGMGEPLDNVDNILLVLNKLISTEYIGMSASRITISTCGLVDRIENVLSKFDVNFAVSLNAAEQEKRKSIMPVTNALGLAEIKKTLTDLAKKYDKRFTLEYVMIANFNMSDEDAKALSQFNPKYFLINLIPLNHSDEKQVRPSEKMINLFSDKLRHLGLNFTRRYRRGADIQADCGQLFLDRAMLGKSKEGCNDDCS